MDILNFMTLTFIKYSLQLKHRFTLSHSSRTETPVVLVKVEQDGIEGFGEASLPPYLSETQDSVISFLRRIKLKNIYSFDDLISLTYEINANSINNNAAKAAVNIALNDLLGKLLNSPIHKFYGIENNTEGKFTSFTIGIDNDDMIREKISEAKQYQIFKIKLGTDRDKNIIKVIRELTDKPLYVDANQGWNDKNHALEMIGWLKEQNVLLIEQPMPVSQLEDSAWLKEKSELPIIADESIQTMDDIIKIKNSFHGINIKLMKCGGLTEAYKMCSIAKENGLKIMIGCMTETSCGISAATQISPLADFIDLDGNRLITNDPFQYDTSVDGKVIIPDMPGLGIKTKQNLF